MFTLLRMELFLMLITNRERIGTWEWEGLKVGLGALVIS
jgi:hypothetical protein